MPRIRKTRRNDDGTAKHHEEMVKQHYLSMKRGQLPTERMRMSPKLYDEKADREYMQYLRDVKKYLRGVPKTAGRRTRRHRTSRRY